MKQFILLLFIGCSIGIAAQNLVPNPGFEEYTTCPGISTDIEAATGWINCGYTPDYYNACANTSFPPLGVPYGFYSGYQEALNGTAYGAITTYSNPDTGHEFIGTQLLQSLIIGTKYFASAYVVKSNLDEFACSVDHVGFRFFSTMPFGESTPAPVDNFSHIYSDSIITDTLTWIRISGSFIADASYQYLVIGNFFDNSLVDTLDCKQGSATYYLIDQVCVSTDSLTCNPIAGIKEPGEKITSVYPNPAINRLYLKNVSPNSTISISNCIGEILKTELLDYTNSIDISSFPNGIYFVKSGINNIVTKFIIENNP